MVPLGVVSKRLVFGEEKSERGGATGVGICGVWASQAARRWITQEWD
jgi:hypothetical protein